MKIDKDFMEKHWIANGIAFSVFIFIINGIVFPIIDKVEITLSGVMFSIVGSLVGGFLYGYVLMLYMRWYRRIKGN